jgi:predicted transcriptional regulator
MEYPKMNEERDASLEIVADIVSAYVSNNSVASGDLAALIGNVHQALLRVSGGTPEEVAEAPKPAVPIKKSVTPDHIICLEDGKKFKSLKRHLRTRYSMSPQEYRAKWGLPSDYPMVAPNYAETRSALAKSMGLGRKASAEAEAPTAQKVRAARAKKAMGTAKAPRAPRVKKEQAAA